MKSLGFEPEDYAEYELVCEVWPDNWLSVVAFERMATQWRVHTGGPYGLDYAALPAVLQMVGIKRKQWPEVFDDIRVMESAALAKLNENSKETR
jgi:hypothetical protein